MFIDITKIYVKAGDGGDGCVSFRREKYVAHGGPNGGDGGKGGDVILRASRNLHTLIDFQYRPHYKAKRGSHGKGSDKFGKKGDDLIVKVPLGTMVYDAETKKNIIDLTIHNQEIVIAHGGCGGKGNAKFKSNAIRAPRIAEKGASGEEITLKLELKLIASVGLVGYPNAGKSTLLSSLSSAHPKIADYPFTTLFPNLGVVKIDEYNNFVVADIPGLIEGAHKGVGLGDKFLRHIERTKVLIHIIDINGYEGNEPLKNFCVVNEELKRYSPALAKKPQIVALNKIDLGHKPKEILNFKNKLKKYKVFSISAITGKGVKDLIYEAYKMLDKIKPAQEIEKEEINYYEYDYQPEFKIKKIKESYIVEGKKIERLVTMTNFEQEESVKKTQRILYKMGIEQQLILAGIEEGDTVKIGKTEFIYKKNEFL